MHDYLFLTPDAIGDLTEIYHFIADKSGLPEVAWTYMQKLRTKCEELEYAPIRGTKRNDIRKGLRVLPIDKNAVTAFEVDEAAQIVTILNVFYGGQDYEAIMGDRSH